MQSSTNKDKRHKILLFLNTLSMKKGIRCSFKSSKSSIIESKLNVKAMSLSVYNIKESVKKLFPFI